MRLLLLSLFATSMACSAPTGRAAEDAEAWSIDARLVEACCCDPICPCIVGSPPTHGGCTGNRLVEIVAGHHAGVRLDGVRLVVTFDVGAWTKYYFDERTSDAQMEQAQELLGRLRGFRFGELLVVERVPLTVERTPSQVAFAVPRANTEIELMRGFEGEPIRVANLESFRDYTQYRSLSVTHESRDAALSFEHSGTNGFTARYRAAGRFEEPAAAGG